MQITSSRNPVTTNLNHSQTFSIANLTKLFKTFSNIYSDPVRAVVRELICNALDASDGVVTVVAPSALNPYLTISDTGPGMDEDFMLSRYTEVGFSTKDDSNDAIGGFGWGRLSALALCDTYTVTTQGRVYVLAKDEHGIPRISVAGVSDESGTHIRVPVPKDKMSLMLERLKDFLKWLPADRYRAIGFNVDPVKKLLETDDVIVLKETVYGLRPQVMIGPVAYEVDYDKAGMYRESLPSRVILKLPIGAVELPPSRESVSYGPVTTDVLKAHTEKVKATLKTELSAKLRALPVWERLSALSTIWDLKDYDGLEEWEKRLRLPTSASIYTHSRRGQHALSPRPEFREVFDIGSAHYLDAAEFYFQDVPDRVYDRIRDRPNKAVVFKPCPWIPDAATLQKYLEKPVISLSSLPLPARVSRPKSAPLVYDNRGNVVSDLPDGAVWFEAGDTPPYPQPPVWYQLSKSAQKAYLNDTHEHMTVWRERVLREVAEDPAYRLYLAARETSLPHWWAHFLDTMPGVFPEATAEYRARQAALAYDRAHLIQWIDPPKVKPMKFPQITKVMRTKKRLDAFLRAQHHRVEPDDYKLFI